MNNLTSYEWVMSELTWYNGVIIYVLLMEIETTRERMIQFAFEEGFTSQNTVEASQFLDLLLNELYRIQLNIRLYLTA
ncbi:Spo0E family sporulation regulatory protein-aspartic acid phosphatase [Priestia sp. 40]|uniref:Spo0E family sporulation regulatory protein-aspartic acid phosphatase n=1 Tax=Priestia sp. 40 TaxID=3394459 RepID=UPI003BF8399E